MIFGENSTIKSVKIPKFSCCEVRKCSFDYFGGRALDFVFWENSTSESVRYYPKLQTKNCKLACPRSVPDFTFFFFSKLYFFSFFTEIHVRQYPGARLVNHQFTIEFSFTKAKNPKGWEWMFLNKIPRLYGDFNSESILVRKIGESPFLFTWTNDSLTQQNCPKTEIRGLFSELIEGQDAAYKTSYGSASSDLKVSYYQCGFF